LKAGERPYVTALDFDVQARFKGGKEYEPLVEVKGLPCWPSEPDFSQLAGGDKKRREGWQFESHWDDRKVATKTLKVIDDFSMNAASGRNNLTMPVAHLAKGGYVVEARVAGKTFARPVALF
jgi:hypothetical protein